MPLLVRGDTSIYYEVSGSGFPLLLLAPGGLDSTIGAWSHAPINPLEVLGDTYQLIAMDQRNAGQSRGPLDPVDPWGTHIEDQLGLADHLGIEAFHVMGCCIGCSYALKLIERAPARVVSAVLEQPIGLVPENQEGWATRWGQWSSALLAHRPDLDAVTAHRCGSAMWDHDFVGAVTREFVAGVSTPIAMLPGVDAIHPRAIGLEIAELARDVELIDPWRDSPASTTAATEAVRAFLARHTPKQ